MTKDSYLNLIVGIIVVVAISAIVIGLIRGRGGEKATQPAPQQAEEGQQKSLPTKYTVAKGDDLWKISEKYYNTGYNWVDIAKENNLANANRITQGLELVIPDVAPKVVDASPAAQAVADVKPSVAGNEYTVEQGDNLWNIAVRAYGDGYKWVDIARANKLDQPDIIHKGNVLQLPR